MIRKRNKIALIGIAAATTLAVAVVTVPVLANHQATDPTLFNPSGISLGVFGPFDVKAEKTGKWDLAIKSHGDTDLRITRVSWLAGGSSGWHSHPGPNLLTVKSGTVTEYEGNDPLCTKTVYTAGQTFGVNGGSAVHLVRAEHGVAAEVIAVAFYPKGAKGTEPKTAPNNCKAIHGENIH